MNHKISLSTLVAVTILSAGCVGTGPNTQQGAVEGGALGALAGAIVGNNSGGHNGLAGALIGGTVGAIAGGTLGNRIDHDNGTIYNTPDEAVAYIYDGAIPPAPAPVVEVVPPAPGVGFIWVNGYWSWNGDQYFWIPGLWTVCPEGCFYARPHWEYRGGRHVFVRGYWYRGRR